MIDSEKVMLRIAEDMFSEKDVADGGTLSAENAVIGWALEARMFSPKLSAGSSMYPLRAERNVVEAEVHNGADVLIMLASAATKVAVIIWLAGCVQVVAALSVTEIEADDDVDCSVR